MSSRTGTVPVTAAAIPATSSALHPLREVGLTMAALGELGALLGPLRPRAATALDRSGPRHAPASTGTGAGRHPGGRARPSTPDPHRGASASPAAALPAVTHRTAQTAQPMAARFLATLRRPANLAFLVALAVVLTAWWVELRPTTFLGGPSTFITVKGTSMLPTLKTGDFVLAETQTSYHVGDLVVYRVPKGQIGAGDDLIHRIVGGNATTGFTLKGDNNPAPDPWTVPKSDVLGKEALAIPGAGSWLLTLRSPIFAGAVAAAIAIWLVLSPPEWTRRRRVATPAASSPAAMEPIPATTPEAPTPPAVRSPARLRPPVAVRRPAAARPAAPATRAPAPTRPPRPAGSTRREQ